MNLKMEQIKKLAAKKAYREAAEIANEINWVKVKDWSILATVINVQEAVGDYEEARDAAIIAYNRNLGGKRLVYKLTQLLIKLKQFDDADELYDEYDRMAYRDADRYVLFYELRKAEGAADSELISILEEYKEQEADEKYLYELAKLYARYDRKEECIKVCDDMIMWFQDGEYVESAIKLKQQLGGALTKMQQKIKDETEKRKSDVEATKEMLFEKQKELLRTKKDELEEALDEDELVELDDADSYKTEHLEIPPMFSNDNDFSVTSVMEALMGTDEADDNLGEEEETDIELEDESEDESEVEPEIKLSERESVSEAEKEVVIMKTESEMDVEDVESLSDEENDKSDMDDEEEDEEPDLEEKMNQIPENIQSMIEDAKRQIDDKYDQINKEDERERLEREKQETLKRLRAREDAMAESVSVPSYNNNIYDTQNIQEALAKNFSEIIDIDKETDDLVGLKPSPKKIEEPKVVVVHSESEEEVDEQIEGQMNLAEWLENVREEKYGKQDTKQYSRSEVVRYLEDRDEKSAAYDKLIEEQKAAKAAALAAENDTESQIKARTQMMLHAAKTDLAIRTGKATLKLEETVSNLKEAAKLAAQNAQADIESEQLQTAYEAQSEDTDTTSETSHTVEMPETVDVDSVVSQENVLSDDDIEAVTDDAKTSESTEIKLNTATFEPVSDEVIKAHRAKDISEESVAVGEAAVSEEGSQEDSDEVVDNINASVNVLDSEKSEDETQAVAPKKKSSKIKLNNPILKGQVVIRDGEKRLTGDLAKLFRKYREMPGIEAQLIDFFENINEEMNTSTSATGNLIISGNSSSDKIDLARTIVRALNFLYPEKSKKIAKTTGDSINTRGIEKAMPKLMGTALIVEEAGAIQPKRIKEILECLSQDTGGMIAIFEDSDAEMNVLINFNPELVKSFNHRIVLKQYTVNELVEIARKYANKKQYEIDEDALLELYLKIDALHNTTESIRLDDIKEIINKAIENAVIRNTKKKFGLMKRTTKSGMNYVMASDFKE